MKKVTTYIARNREFYIVKDDEGRYWGIESKWFVNGVLTKEFNGITGHMSTTIKDTISRVNDTIEIDYLMGRGLTLTEAMELHFASMF